MESKPPKQDSSLIETKLGFWLILIAILTVIWGLWFLLPDRLSSQYSDIREKGSYGDSFGTINSLFTGLAFGGLLFTIFLQRHELRLQRKELELQRNEMVASRGELAAQVKAQARLLRAQITEMELTALNATIPAAELRAQRWTPGTDPHNREVQYILDKAAKMSEHVDKLKKDLET